MRTVRYIGCFLALSACMLPGSLEAVSPKPGLFDNRGHCPKTGAWIPDPQKGVDVPEPLRASGMGGHRAIVLLVEFTDRRADKVNHSPAAFKRLLFDSTGAVVTGSMFEYFQEVSYGDFSICGEVSVWMQAPQTSRYYSDGEFGQGAWPRNRIRLAYDIVVSADPYIDFSQYDGDSDGMVDALFIVHAGPGGEETGDTDDIWSHKGTLPANASGTGNGYVTDDSVKVAAYTMQPEKHDDGRLISIGVFCHEYGHVLGLPDLYDRDNSSSGIGNWGLMGGGSWGGDGRSPEIPVHLCAWSKEQLGWIRPIVVTQNLGGFPIQRVEDHPEVYKLWTEGTPKNEYFLIENRQSAGFDSGLPNGGVLIWHIDNSVTTQNDNELLKLVDLESADGNRDMDRGPNRGDAGDPFPGTTGNKNFEFSSQPNSRTNDGEPSQVSVLNVSDSQHTMVADLHVFTEHPILSLEDCTVIDSQGNADGKADPGEEVQFVVTLKNRGRRATQVTGTLISSGPTLDILTEDELFSDIPFNSTGDNRSHPFLFSVAPSADVHYAYLTLDVRTDGGTYATQLSFRLVIGHPAILLVNGDDASGNSEWTFDAAGIYATALDSIGEVHDYWKCENEGRPTGDLLKTYEVVVWFTGLANPPLQAEDLDHVRSFLDGGGGLFISGQDVGFSLQHSSFLTEYMHAQLIENDSNEGFVTGVPDDPISGDILGLLVLDGGNEIQEQPSPDVILPLSGAASVFKYAPSGRTAALKYAADYRVVYFAFGFETLSSPDPNRGKVRADLMANIVEWLKGGPTEVEHPSHENTLPQEYALSQNYPNPFNPITDIRFQIVENRWSLPTTLKIFNLLGQEIRTLVNVPLESGCYTVTWDGRDGHGHEMASGVYFYRIQSEHFSQTKRMVLLK